LLAGQPSLFIAVALSLLLKPNQHVGIEHSNDAATQKLTPNGIVNAPHFEFNSGTFQPLEEITTRLLNDFYLVEVRLISKAKSLLVQTLNFNLEVTRTPGWDMKLTEIKDLTPLEIRRTVEAFLKEGSDMLNSFPRMGEVSAEIERIDEWETRSTRFLNQYPDLFSTAFFLSDYPEESPSGLAHGTLAFAQTTRNTAVKIEGVP
jgi:hypothetical protein